MKSGALKMMVDKVTIFLYVLPSFMKNIIIVSKLNSTAIVTMKT